MRSALTILTMAFTACLLASLAGGCAAHTEPVGPAPELSTEARAFDATWQRSLRVLRAYRFDPVMEDRRSGMIVTRPMVSRNATEFWRDEASTTRDVVEGTLHAIYRIATVQVVPAGEGEAFRAVVEVEVKRSDRREPMVTSTSQAFDLFTGAAQSDLSVGYGEEAKSPASHGLVGLGHDEQLAARIAADINLSSGQ